MKLVPEIVSWQVPTDPSVVKHNVYYCLLAEAISYETTPKVEVLMPTCEIDLNILPIKTNGEEYKLALTATDQKGHESSFSTEKVMALDNTPPNPPIWN